MTTSQAATRLTCFALLSSIEEDLREFVRARGPLDSGTLDPELRTRARARWEENTNARGLEPSSEDELLSYTDFGDLAAILARMKSRLPDADQQWIGTTVPKLQKHVSVRNRVCHSRPLEADDFAETLDLASEFVKNRKSDFFQTDVAINRLNTNPSYVLHLRIPEFWAAEEPSISNNLPLPEFDDTGFLGRNRDRKELAKLLLSAHPIVTVVGEGGVGKTALALRCLYDLLEHGDAPFQAIVWVSTKMRVLTPHGVSEIKDAVASTLGLLQQIATTLGAPKNSAPGELSELIEEIAEYMRQFRVLLAIDNLETIPISELRPLLLAVPAGSKVLLTSRVGLGELEVRYALDSLDEETAVKLARSVAATRNVAFLARAEHEVLASYCKGLFYNPLLIKWFVGAVSMGATVSSLLHRDKTTYQAVIRFCFENLFERLSDHERQILHVLASARRPLSHAELVYILSDLKTDELEWALNVLHQSSMLRRSIENKANPSTHYSLTAIASEFLALRAPPAKELFERVQRQLKYLQGLAAEKQRILFDTHKYDMGVVAASLKDELICAAFLRKALDELRRGRHSDALKNVARSKELLPRYSESYRIAGLIEADRGDLFRALDEFEHAADLAPNSPIVFYTQAQTMLRHNDPSGALVALDRALTIDKADPTLRTARAATLVRLGQYEEASKIYRALEDGLEKRPRRYRLATRDQQADCYRRWMEHDRKELDEVSYKAHLEEALLVLSSAIRAGDFDENTLYRLERIVDEVNKFDSQEVHGLGERIDAFIQQHQELWMSKSLMLRQRTKAVPQTSREGVVVSWLHTYGFIQEETGERWFFAGSHVLNLASEKVELGRRVRFNLGSNDRGPCAKDVVFVDNPERS